MKIFLVVLYRDYYEGGDEVIETCATREVAEEVIAYHLKEAAMYKKAQDRCFAWVDAGMKGKDRESPKSAHPWYCDDPPRLHVEEWSLIETFNPEEAG